MKTQILEQFKALFIASGQTEQDIKINLADLSKMKTQATTLKEIAKGFGLYLVGDIPAKYKTEYFDHKLKIEHKTIPEFLLTLDSIEIGLFYKCNDQTNYDKSITYYIDHSYILVKLKTGGLLTMLKQDRNGKYYLHPYYDILYKYQDIDYNRKERELKTIQEPNYIGVFNSKKITDWLFYCDSYIEVMERVYNDLKSANEDICNEIASFIDSLPKKEVVKSKDDSKEQKTWVKTDLFEVIFTHYKGSKFLHTDIKFRGGLNDVKNILTLTK